MKIMEIMENYENVIDTQDQAPVQEIPDIDAAYEAWYNAKPTDLLYVSAPQVDEEAAYDDILAEAAAIRSTDEVPMSLDDFDTELTLSFAPVLKIEGWLDAWHKMVTMGYAPGTILNAAELVARMCYTEQSVAADFELLKDKVPPILRAVYTAVNTRLIVNAAGFRTQFYGLMSQLGDKSPDLYVVCQGIKTRYEQLRDEGSDKTRVLTQQSSQLLPYAKLFGISLRRNESNGCAYNGWGILEGDLAADLGELAISLGIKLQPGRLEKALGAAARQKTFRLNAEVLDAINTHCGGWDPAVDKDGYQVLAECIPSDDPAEYVYKGIKRFYQTSVRKFLNGSVQSVVLCLNGRKGCGKSSLSKFIFTCVPDVDGTFKPQPQTIQELEEFTSSELFDDSGASFADSSIRETQVSLASHFGVELAEFSTSKADENNFKRTVTSQKLSARMLYDKFATKFQTASAMVATLDHISLSGTDRRILDINITKDSMIDMGRILSELDSAKLWAQAYYEVTHGLLVEWTPALREMQEKAQLNAVEESPVEAALRANFFIGCTCKPDRKELCAVPSTDLDLMVKELLGREPKKGEVKQLLTKMGLKQVITDHPAFPDKKSVLCWTGIYPIGSVIRARCDNTKSVFSKTSGYGAMVYDADMSSKPGFHSDDAAVTSTSATTTATETKTAEGEKVRAETMSSAYTYTMDGGKPLSQQTEPAQQDIPADDIDVDIPF